MMDKTFKILHNYLTERKNKEARYPPTKHYGSLNIAEIVTVAAVALAIPYTANSYLNSCTQATMTNL